MQFRIGAGGGPRAVLYTLKKAWEAGGFLKFYRRMASRNACKTCAVGMGGQSGGMVNEAGHFPEVCKKSVQAQTADMQPAFAESFLKEHSLKALSKWTSRELENAGRIGFPMFAAAGDTHFRKIPWDEANAKIAAALKRAKPERSFFYASGRASNEAAFLMQLFARAFGTNHVNNCSYYCHQASGVALGRAFGSGTATLALEDLEKSDFVMLLGANPASNHPRLLTQLVDLRERGGEVVVVNPLKELGLVRFRVPSKVKSMLLGSDVASLYVQPRIGGDIAFLMGVAKHVLEHSGVDENFVREHCAGWNDVKREIEQTPWSAVVEGSGIAEEIIRETGSRYLRAERAVFMWAMGLTHHEHGVKNVHAVVNLALMRGMAGREGAGLLPIRGHSNVQGVGTMGFAPALKDAMAQAVEREFSMTLPTHKGWSTYEAMVAAEAGGVDFAMMLGGNLYAANPNLDFAKRALSNIPLTVYVSTKLNLGHVHGRGKECLILPALARDEEFQPTTQESMFNFVRLSDGGAPPPSSEARSEVRIVADLAESVLPPSNIPWKEFHGHAAIRKAIAKTVPGLAPLAEMDATRREFAIEGRIFRRPRFNTPDGRAHFHATPLPRNGNRNGNGDGMLSLMTIRSEGQFNTVVYEEEDLYRGVERRDVILMNARDAERLGFRENDRVRVSNDTGAIENFLVRFTDISQGGAAMYYPEANVLVPRAIDPESGTPAFKNVRVRVERA